MTAYSPFRDFLLKILEVSIAVILWMSVTDDPVIELGIEVPIEFENIPSDVCPGENNEWRVTGFLWDLIETHEDLEDSVKMPFKDFWKFTLNKNFRKILSIFLRKSQNR